MSGMARVHSRGSLGHHGTTSSWYSLRYLMMPRDAKLVVIHQSSESANRDWGTEQDEGFWEAQLAALFPDIRLTGG